MPIQLVGQLVEVTAWFLTVQAICKCDAPVALLMVGVPGGMQGQCPNCKANWVLTGMTFDQSKGTVDFQFGRKA